MSLFIKGVNSLFPLSEEASAELSDCFQTRDYKKGEVIHAHGRICKCLFFVEEGLVKHNYYHKDNQYVLRFFEEEDFFIATDSFFNNLPAEYSTIAIEDTRISYLEYEDFERFCQTYHSFESFARRFVSMVAYTAISNLKNLLYLDATERYARFIEEYGHLQQRISLGDTAGFLGISQVSLSRIRSRK
ncbi:Crp/Fnr family transcriptional regulator [Saccharicrinis sp. FJH54]|uniref:Crp/Fnr family transcriptional regulator n=1 Tax=Saccharicrinis sp. FJH54 TaxID=3344665 RepID=UPI0035D43781